MLGSGDDEHVVEERETSVTSLTHVSAIAVRTTDSYIALDIPIHAAKVPEVLARGRTIRKTNIHRGMEAAK